MRRKNCESGQKIYATTHKIKNTHIYKTFSKIKHIFNTFKKN